MLETDDAAGKVGFVHVPSGGLGTVREPFKCARSDMTDKEENWYSSHWAYDLTMCCDKTISGEYVLARPSKKPGGPELCVIFLVLLGMVFEFAQVFSEEEEMAAANPINYSSKQPPSHSSPAPPCPSSQ